MSSCQKLMNSVLTPVGVGIEVLAKLETVRKVRDFASRPGDFGLAVGAIRSGGTLHDSRSLDYASGIWDELES